MSVVDKITGTQSGDFTVGSTGPNPRKLVATATGLEVQDAAGNPVSVESANSGRLDRHLINIPEAPGDTVEFRGWAAFPSKLIKAKVSCTTVNTVGNYTLTVTNNATGNTMLSGASFNLNNLQPNAVTNLTLTGVSNDLNLSENDRWTISVASNDAGMDASGIYVDLVFEVP